MFDFHKQIKQYFEWQHIISRDYILPFIAEQIELNQNSKILEIGCGEAGVLKAFTEKGISSHGIELSQLRVDRAKEFMSEEIEKKLFSIDNSNIYDIDPSTNSQYKYDLIILKDVIEHIPEQAKFMEHLKGFLKPDGLVFFAFPPWLMPFGGHQQICKNKLLSKLPYYHLLPSWLYKGILKLGGENEGIIKELLELQDTGIRIERFENICKAKGYNILKEQHYLFNPIYQYKFGVAPKRQLGLINHIPWVRNFVTTCSYYLVGK